jgi:hypothetical protein
MERNICDKCADKTQVLNIDLADTGRCSKCGNIGDCWDHDLIGFYKTFSLTDEQIYKNLPRLLNTNLNGSSYENLSALGNKINKLIDIEKAELSFLG